MQIDVCYFKMKIVHDIVILKAHYGFQDCTYACKIIIYHPMNTIYLRIWANEWKLVFRDMAFLGGLSYLTSRGAGFECWCSLYGIDRLWERRKGSWKISVSMTGWCCLNISVVFCPFYFAVWLHCVLGCCLNISLVFCAFYFAVCLHCVVGCCLNMSLVFCALYFAVRLHCVVACEGVAGKFSVHKQELSTDLLGAYNANDIKTSVYVSN